MNFNEEIKALKNKQTSINWNKKLFQLCNDISLPIIVEQHLTRQYLFRARKVDNIMALQKWDKKDFATRKAYDITNYGRLNKPYEEMMYFNRKLQ